VIAEHVLLKVGDSVAATDMDAKLNVQHTRNVVGSFYEALAAFLFDAVRWRGGEVYAYEKDRGYEGPMGDADDPPCMSPDLVQRTRASFIEVKGGNAWSQFKIYRWQALLYDNIRCHGTYPIYRPRVEYAIFVHKLQRMTKRLKTPRNLIAGLAQNTECCLLVDLDILLRFHKLVVPVSYGDEHSRKYYPTFYPVTAKHIRRIMSEPSAVLTELELKRNQFSITNYLGGESEAPLFERVAVGDTALTPFPVVTIRRKRHPRAPYTGAVDPSWLTHVRQETLFPPERDPLDRLAGDINYEQNEDDFPF